MIAYTSTGREWSQHMTGTSFCVERMITLLNQRSYGKQIHIQMRT